MSRYVVRYGAFGDLYADNSRYLQADGSWGAYATAKRLVSIDAAEQFHRKFFADENFGVFPVSSTSRPR
jgi:hypothetical protein